MPDSEPTGAEEAADIDATATTEPAAETDVQPNSDTPPPPAPGGSTPTKGGSPPDGSSDGDWLSKAVPLAIDLGWTMAVLYGRLIPAPETIGHLPSEHELEQSERIEVEVERLSCLLKQLAALPEVIGDLSGCHDKANGWAESTPDNLSDAVETLNVELLKALACSGREMGRAYQLGRSLRDTVNPPETKKGPVADVLNALARGRVSIVQEWLKVLAPHLPSEAAGTVSASLGHWSEFASVTIDVTSPGQLRGQLSGFDGFAEEMRRLLLPQGDVWLDLLTGVDSTKGLLTPEAYVSAAEAAVSRAARLVGKVVKHYWPALAVLLVSLGGVLYLGAAFLGGAGRVWTDIAGIVGSLGVTVKGIGTSVGRLVEGGAKPIYGLEEVDANAWAITTLPTAKITARGVYALRRSGVARSTRLGRG